MKKLIIALGCLALWSCSDEDFTAETDKSTSRMTTLNLYNFDETLIHPGLDADSNNKNAIQAAINYVEAHPDLYDGVEIGEVDCYLKVAGNSGLHLPSNFALVMGNNTHLRIAPTGGTAGYSLIELSQNGDVGPTYPHNILITGGHLYGDRREHIGTSIQGHVIRLWTCDTVDIDGVEINDSNFDGICISGSEMDLNATNYTPPSHINITNCTFRNSRRHDISIVDGHDMDISFNKFYDAGSTMTKTDGQPSGGIEGIAVDVEGFKGGTYLWYQHPQQINIHNNSEQGSLSAAYYASVASFVTIQSNTSQHFIGYKYSDHIQVLDNTVTGPANFGIVGGISGITPVIHDNLIQNNKVENCGIALIIYGSDTEVRENEFKNFGVGMQFQCIDNVSIIANSFQSDLTGCRGIQQENSPSHPEYYFADNFNIEGNVFLINGGITGHAAFIDTINSRPEYADFTVNISGNAFTASGQFHLGGVNGFNVDHNNLRTDMGMWIVANAKKVIIKNNDIICDPRLNPQSPVNYSLINAININGCNDSNNIISSNEISNLSTNNNTHIMQITNSSLLQVVGNKMVQQVSKIIDVTLPAPGSTTPPSSNLTFLENVGEIGSCSVSPYLIYAPNCPGIVATNNVASSLPTVRQNINGVGPWGCP